MNFDCEIILDNVLAARSRGESLMAHCLPIREFRDYVAQALTDNLRDGVKNYEDYQVSHKFIFGSGELEREGFAVAVRAGHRYNTDYLLTENELSLANQMFREEPLLPLTINVISDILGDYFFRLQYEAGINPKYKDIYPTLRAYSEESKGLSMMRELAPAMAHSIFESGWRKGNCLEGHHFAEGLQAAFAKSAFTSIGAHTNAVRVCPFSKFITRIFNTVVKQDENGKIYADHEQELPGALPKTIYDRLKQLEAVPA